MLVRLDANGGVTARTEAPKGASGWDRRDDVLFVVGEGEASLAQYSLAEDGLAHVATHSIDGVTGLRDIALGSGSLAMVSEPAGHRLHTLDLETGERRTLRECHGALGITRAGAHVVANCLLDHELVVFAVDDAGFSERATIQHDGPIWGAAARETAEGIELVALGVEDRPLDRSEGFFGYVDSFLFAYTVTATGETRAGPVVNLSEFGVVTPKSAHFEDDVLFVTGYGADRIGRVRDVFGEPRVDSIDAPAGLTELAGTPQRGLAADPLLDAWVVFEDGHWRSVAQDAQHDRRSASVRLGEALAFTTLMGPSNTSDGKMSRFTCETCHFEGRTDGRVHFTGRGKVHAATKTLRGLGANRPHFSRALDRSATQMVINEFKVVSKGTDQDPWFTLELDEEPWVRELWPGTDPTALELRRALLEFLTSFDPVPNPHARSRSGFSELEHRGADAFARHCERCHSARLVTDDGSTQVERDEWEKEIFGAGSIKWASEGRVKTGIEPYVHDEGARPPSLRRLWVKFPYFTNGSSSSLEDVLERVRVGAEFSHGGGDGTSLTGEDQQALLAFLRIL